MASNEAPPAALCRDMVFRYNRQGMIVGYESGDDLEPLSQADEVIGKSISDIIPEPVGSLIRQSIEQTLIRRRPQIIEYELVQEGATHTYEGRILISGQDEVALLVRDITEQRQAEQLLKLQHQAATALGTAKDFESALEWLLEAVCKIEPITCAGMYIVDPETGALDLYAHRGISDAFADAVQHYEAQEAETLLVMKGEPVYLSHGDVLSPRDEVRRFEGPQGLAAIPMTYEGRLVAVMNAGSHKSDQIPPLVRRTLEAIAAQLGGILARRRTEEQIRRRMVLDELISSMSARIISSDPVIVDEALHDTLDAVGRFVGADRSYLYAFQDDQGTIERAYEWCAEGVLPRGEGRRTMSQEQYQWSVGKFARREVILIGKMSELPPEAQAERELWESLGIRSIYAIPVVIDNRTIGFFGFNAEREERTWGQDEITLLKMTAELFANVIARRRAYEALAESEHRFREMAENILDVFYMESPAERKVLYVSPAYERIWGRSRQSLLDHPESWVEGVLPEDRKKIEAGFVQLAHGIPLDDEYRVVRPDGSVRWVRDRAFPILAPDGTFLRTVGVVRDVTEQRQAELALQHSERQYRSLIENAADFISILARDGTILYESPAVEKVLGYRPEELIGRNIFDFAHPEEAPRLRSLFEEVLASPNRNRSSECQARHRDESWRILECTAQNLLEDPAVNGVVFNARDITERRRAEEASLVFARGIEQSSEAIVITDANIRITFMNKAAEDLMGLSAKETYGRYPHEVFGIDVPTREEIQAGIGSQGSWSGPVDVHDPHGTKIPLQMSVLLISDERNTPLATVCIARSARKTRQLESLQHVTEIVADTRAADEKTIQGVMSHLRELVGVDRWGIYLHSPQEDMLELKYFSENSQGLASVSQRFPVAATLQGQVFRTGEILFTPDISSDHRFVRSPTFRKLIPLVEQTQMKATCILPIRAGSRILGTLNVSDRRVRNFSPEELTLLKTLANQLGVLISRSQPVSDEQPNQVRPVPTEPQEEVPVVAASQAMKRVLEDARRLSMTDMPVMVLGPTGAGKGHLAKYVHSISPRSQGPFLMVNCACLDGELILSELFGHERGAFTGAVRQQKGCFELANGGTLLLDEVVELPQSAQAKLLQLVETQRFRRIGGEQTIITDVRIICTTNADVRECVRTGKMRQDLYYRLSAGTIVVPPLCERPEDIELLAQNYIRTQAMATGQPANILTASAIARLQEYHWPGNVRELQNVLAHASARGSRIIGIKDLRFSPATHDPLPDDRVVSDRPEREIILDVLRRNRWNRSSAADELGMHRNTLRHRMKKYGIEK